MAVVKQVGTSGQISPGKEFAGRTVLMESPEAGVLGDQNRHHHSRFGALAPRSRATCRRAGIQRSKERAVLASFGLQLNRLLSATAASVKSPAAQAR